MEHNEFTANGEQCLNCLSQPRGQPQLINLWQRESLIISSLDYAKQEDVRERIWQQRWDLVIIDEAHKCSAYTKRSAGRGDEVDRPF
jgi:hypothetical protein